MALRDDVGKEFPIIDYYSALGKPLIYLDNAATTQKPKVVIDRLCEYYKKENANVHRAVYDLGYAASQAYETARQTVSRFVNATRSEEIIFTRSTTESINLVAQSFVALQLKKGDNIVVSIMEHHSNFVPWQQLCIQYGAELRTIPLRTAGQLDMEKAAALIDHRTRLLSVVHISNSIGIVNPVKALIKLAHSQGVPVLIDAAQSVARQNIDVKQLDCEFLVFSGTKCMAPQVLAYYMPNQLIWKQCSLISMEAI